MLDLNLATADELSQELGARLRRQRLNLRITQAELAARVGLNIGTIKNIESRAGASSLASIVRVAQVLGVAERFQSLFVVEARSIAQMERKQSATRQRARPKVIP